MSTALKLLVFPTTSTSPFPFTSNLLSTNHHHTIYQLSNDSLSTHERLRFISQSHIASVMVGIDVVIINMTHISPADSDSFHLIRYILKLIENSHQANDTVPWRGKIILLSNCMTWANSVDVGEEGFSDLESVCRIPHPAFQSHYQIEKIVAKMRDLSAGVSVHVVFSGLWYGRDEIAWHGAFKMAREATEALQLPLYTTDASPQGENTIPSVHVDDLAQILNKLIASGVHDVDESDEPDTTNTPQNAETLPPSLLSPTSDGSTPPLYIFAVDRVLNTQRDMVAAIAKVYGHDATEFDTISENTPKALLFEYHAYLTLNLKCELNEWIQKHVYGEWHTLSTGFADNAALLKKEYETSRNLEPLRIVVHGPPMCGKSLCSQSLSKFYQLPHLHIKGVLDAFFGQEADIGAQLAEKQIDAAQWLGDYKQQLAKKKGGKGDEPLDSDAQIAALKQQLLDLDTLKQDLQEDPNAGKKPAKGKAPPKGKGAPPEEEEVDRGPRYSDRVIVQAFRWRLSKLDCKNHGWIMDGFPKTPAQAVDLFSLPEENPAPVDTKGKKAPPPKKGAPVEEPVKPRLANPQFIPNFVFSLSVPTDALLLSNLNQIPAEVLDQNKAHLSDKALLRRLTEYNKQNSAHLVEITPRGEEEVTTEADASEGDVFNTIAALRTTAPPVVEEKSEVEATAETAEDTAEFERENEQAEQEHETPEVQSRVIPLQSEDGEQTPLTRAVQDTCQVMFNDAGEPHTYEKPYASIQDAVEEVLKTSTTVLSEALNDDASPQEEVEDGSDLSQSAATTQDVPLEENPDYLEEQRILDEKAAPLKEKLVNSVLPSLTKALIDCCMYRPEDPLSFLSDKLLEASAELEGGM